MYSRFGFYPVDINFSDKRFRQLCESRPRLQREHGQSCARKVAARLQDLEASASLDEMRSLPGDCHELKGSRAGELAIKVGGAKRLILEPAVDPAPRKADGGLDWVSVTSVRILEITDYHD